MANQQKHQKQESLFTNYKFYLGISVIELVIIIILAVMLARGKSEEATDQPDLPPEQTEDVSPETTEQPETEEEPEPENNLEENSHASIDRLVEKYCSYIAEGDVDGLEEIVDMLTDDEKEKIQSRAAVIESFDNVTCYTKNGPVEDSFIVFVCYDMKLVGIETSAPDIICLYVGPKGDEGRRIHYGSIDEEMQEYVAELEKDPEVQALYDDVSTRYQEAQEKDETLAAFVQRLNGQVEEPEEPAEETQEEEQPSEEPAEEPAEEEGGATPENREIQLADTVNIRSDTSTDAEKLTVAYQGDMITLIESYENGWTKVEYRGITGYAKTEFLE